MTEEVIATEVVASPDVPVPAEKTEDSNLDRRTIFVRAIPPDATNESLSEFFSDFAPVRHAVIVLDAEKKSRGFGFVSFASDEDALTALQNSKKTKFMGKLLRADLANRRDRKDNASAVKKDQYQIKPELKSLQKTARLIVRNLPWSVRTPEDLKEIFTKWGIVKDVHIPRKKGGRMTGFGFVTMTKHSVAQKVVSESVGLKIHGREVAVDFAIDKTKYEDLKQSNEQEEAAKESENDDQEKSDGGEDDDDEDSESEDNETKEKDDKEDKSDDSDDDEDDDDDDDVELLGLELNDDEAKKNKQEQFSIFVRNVPYDATQESLEEHFSKFGSVKYALPVIDKESGLSKGSAFVVFHKSHDYEECLLNAPEIKTNTILIPDDVSPLYVYEGRILSLTPAVDRESAARLQERNSQARKELLGRAPGEKDKRNLFLLNEGRIMEGSKLSQVITEAEMSIREKSYNLRVQQLNKNPTLHLSLTRLAIRNLPRMMNEKSLKALGRKAVVQFATEVKDSKRQPITKEEAIRSTKHKEFVDELLGITEDEKSKTKKSGVVKQAKVITEVKGSGEFGRSRGYGFLEFRDHKAALMALRWLNAHEVKYDEIVEGMDEEQLKIAKTEGIKPRRLIVEFAIENAKVIKRRREQIILSRNKNKNQKRKREDGDDNSSNKRNKKDTNSKLTPKQLANQKRGKKKGNMNKGAPKNSNNNGDDNKESAQTGKSGVSEDVKKIIAQKRRRRKGKN